MIVMWERAARSALAAVVIGVVAAPWSAGTAWADEIDDVRASAAVPGPECHPKADLARPQLIVGYGSLMQDVSRRETAPQAGSALPVEVTGYRRGWFAAGQLPGFNTVFLGVVPQDGARMNAVLFEVPPAEIAALDEREYVYCRVAVPAADVAVLDGAAKLPEGQAWIYVSQADIVAFPSGQVPIIQSYVDIFLSGCFELEDAHRLPGFAQRCITSTTDWSPHWVNDRIHPRQPLDDQPLADRIDALIKAELPEDFAAIRIE